MPLGGLPGQPAEHEVSPAEKPFLWAPVGGLTGHKPHAQRLPSSSEAGQRSPGTHPIVIQSILSGWKRHRGSLSQFNKMQRFTAQLMASLYNIALLLQYLQLG